MPDADEFVHVRLSGDTSSTPGRVSRAAFDQFWQAKGWVLVDEEEAALAMSPETSTTESTTNKKRGN